MGRRRLGRLNLKENKPLLHTNKRRKILPLERLLRVLKPTRKRKEQRSQQTLPVKEA
jgi:hypothetical protein